MVEDDYSSIGGGAQMTHPNLSLDLKKVVKSAIKPEFV